MLHKFFFLQRREGLGCCGLVVKASGLWSQGGKFQSQKEGKRGWAKWLNIAFPSTYLPGMTLNKARHYKCSPGDTEAVGRLSTQFEKLFGGVSYHPKPCIFHTHTQQTQLPSSLPVLRLSLTRFPPEKALPRST